MGLIMFFTILIEYKAYSCCQQYRKEVADSIPASLIMILVPICIVISNHHMNEATDCPAWNIPISYDFFSMMKFSVDIIATVIMSFAISFGLVLYLHIVVSTFSFLMTDLTWYTDILSIYSVLLYNCLVFVMMGCN